MAQKLKPKEKPHYVNNKEFSQAVMDYAVEARSAREKDTQIPKVTDYIAKCFIRIAEGLSHRPNFVRYTYREEMVMDAVENCLRAIANYNIETATRTGKPNAFSYFTQICYFAFIRRITKEKKQQEIKLKYLTKSGIESFIDTGNEEVAAGTAAHFVDTLKDRIARVRTTDNEVKEIVKQEKKKRKARIADSDLSEFME